MKLLVVFALVAAAYAAPQRQQDSQDVRVLRFENDNSGLGEYSFSFEQSDGTKREERGSLKNAGSENEAIVVQGSYEWIGPDAVNHIVTYTADENGFKPVVSQGPGGTINSQIIASIIG